MIGRIHSIETFGTVDGPGIRFVAFMQGCPLRCLFCHNPDTWDAAGECQYELTPSQLVEEVVKYRSFIKTGGVTLSGGEPLMQATFAREFFRLCHEEGLHTTLDTSGAYCSEAAFGVLDYTDLVLLDIKTADHAMYPRLTHGSLDTNKRFLDELEHRDIGVWVRHVVVPGYTDNDELLEQLGQYVAKYGVVKKIEVLPYHTLGVFKYDKLGIDYPLKGVAPLTAERTAKVREILSKYKPCH